MDVLGIGAEAGKAVLGQVTEHRQQKMRRANERVEALRKMIPLIVKATMAANTSWSEREARRNLSGDEHTAAGKRADDWNAKSTEHCLELTGLASTYGDLPESAKVTPASLHRHLERWRSNLFGRIDDPLAPSRFKAQLESDIEALIRHEERVLSTVGTPKAKAVSEETFEFQWIRDFEPKGKTLVVR